MKSTLRAMLSKILVLFATIGFPSIMTGCRTAPKFQDVNAIYFEDIQQFKERKLTDSEIDELRKLINVNDNRELTPPDTKLYWYGVNPRYKYRIYCISFSHSGFNFLDDGTPMFSVDTMTGKRLQEFVVRLSRKHKDDLHRSWSVGGPIYQDPSN